MILRKKTKKIKIGNIFIGSSEPIAIQSMTNTRTKDTKATINQILELEKAGCDIVRCAVLDEDDAMALSTIKKEIHIPLVADIHFDSRLALIAINSGIDKLRLNPGNITDENKTKLIVEACKEKNIPIRIGVNAGSLEKEFVEKYGYTKEAMIASAQRHVNILESLDFHNIVISLKASSLDLCLDAYRLASETFEYPLHIGITESGTKFSGTIKSSIGISTLLNEGIGDTLRVSLACDPVEEVKVGKEILATLGLYKKPTLICCPTCGRTQYDMFKVVDQIEKYLETIKKPIKVAVMGCVVNGPGEGKHADIGIAGGIGEAILFKKGAIIRKIKEENIVEELIKEIDQMCI